MFIHKSVDLTFSSKDPTPDTCHAHFIQHNFLRTMHHVYKKAVQNNEVLKTTPTLLVCYVQDIF